MLPRLISTNWKIASTRSFHRSTPDIRPHNTDRVSNPFTKQVRVRHLKSLRILIGQSLHCNVEHKNAKKHKYYNRVRVNHYPLTVAGRDSHIIELGDFFTLDTQVYPMLNGIYYKTKRAEIVNIEKRDKSKETPKVLKPGMRQIILSEREKWRYLVTLSITVTKKYFFRRIMHSDIPKKGQAAFELMIRLCPAEKRSQHYFDKDLRPIKISKS